MHNAAEYVLGEWEGIENIFSSGKYSLDNNAIERVNRLISLSRRNSLFFGSHAGAQRGCIFYSLACSCRNLGINFFDYLSDILNRTASMPPGSPAESYRPPPGPMDKRRAGPVTLLSLYRLDVDAETLTVYAVGCPFWSI